jgi:hypothetical protein
MLQTMVYDDFTFDEFYQLSLACLDGYFGWYYDFDFHDVDQWYFYGALGHYWYHNTRAKTGLYFKEPYMIEVTND